MERGRQLFLYPPIPAQSATAPTGPRGASVRASGLTIVERDRRCWQAAEKRANGAALWPNPSAPRPPCEVSERLQEAQMQQARQARIPALRGSFAASSAQAVSSGGNSGSAARPAELCRVSNRTRQPGSWDGGREGW
jgi:hypothetical protein